MDESETKCKVCDTVLGKDEATRCYVCADELCEECAAVEGQWVKNDAYLCEECIRGFFKNEKQIKHTKRWKTKRVTPW